ncbi:hypothetical protein BDB01DRAFT_830563 [Pilobolus umbonatus]|nr:hypothetical protein BDB01DRAFT_830563 [Pilobolus umbonatus]
MKKTIHTEYDYTVGIVVNVDFRSETTVCAYAPCEENENIHLIDKWPQIPKSNEIALPTKIHYKRNTETVYSIGDTIQNSRIESFSEIPQSLKAEVNIRKAADFLREVNNHIIQTITVFHEKKNKLNPVPRLRYCITVQHLDKCYRDNLAKAVEMAGIRSAADRIDKVLYIDMYEALAIGLLSKKTIANDRFLICNIQNDFTAITPMEAKGGVASTLPSLQEYSELGADKLDEYFEGYIKQIILDLPSNNLPKSLDHSLNVMSKEFKRTMMFSIDFSHPKDIFLRPPPILSNAMLSNKFIQLEMDKLKEKVYDPLLDKIIDTLLSIIQDMDIKTCFFTGKLSSLPYFKSKLEEKLKSVSMLIIPENENHAINGAMSWVANAPLATQRTAPYISDVGQGERSKKGTSEFLDEGDSVYTHIIGIDFGTSYSKWYYQAVNSDNEVEFEDNVMISQSLAILHPISKSTYKWGYEAFEHYYGSSQAGSLLSRFKLLLHDPLAKGLDELNAINVISEYLKDLHSRIMETMKDIFNNKKSKFRYCMTVPVIWNDIQKRCMRSAAIKAGIISDADNPLKLLLLSEPETAAVYYSRNEEILSNLKPVITRTVICDAGGGTVDVTTYEYTKTDAGKLAIKEITSGSGHLCGSSFLDDSFKTLLLAKCHALLFTPNGLDIRNCVQNFVSNIKTEFGNGNLKPYQMTVSGHEVVITYKEMEEKVFKPIVSAIISLIAYQLRLNMLDHIIVTGGFSQSPYLQTQLKKKFGNSCFIYFGRPDEYSRAVVKGAILLAANPSIITQRTISRTYGIDIVAPFRKIKDPFDHRYIDNDNREWCRFVFNEIATREDVFEPNGYVEKQYWVTYPNDTYAAIYSTDVHEKKIYSTADRRAYLVAKRDIDTSKLTGFNVGDLIPVYIRLYFGRPEIQLEIRYSHISERYSFSSNTMILRKEDFNMAQNTLP